MQQLPPEPRPPGRQSGTAYVSEAASGLIRNSPTPPRYSLVRDTYRGAVLGDFAPAIGIPGAVVQAVLGYVPVLGTITALRDAAAGWRKHDAVGIVLNSLAVFPVLGGVAKTADVLHGLRGLHGLHRAYTSTQNTDTADSREIAAPVAVRTGFGCLGLAISIIVLACGLLYSLSIHAASQYAARVWPLAADTPFIGNGALVVTFGLAAVGLSIGEVICLGNRAWLGVIYLPAVLYVGLQLAIPLRFIV